MECLDNLFTLDFRVLFLDEPKPEVLGYPLILNIIIDLSSPTTGVSQFGVYGSRTSNDLLFCTDSKPLGLSKEYYQSFWINEDALYDRLLYRRCGWREGGLVIFGSGGQPMMWSEFGLSHRPVRGGKALMTHPAVVNKRLPVPDETVVRR